jgi:predicted DsbA family dithiol-disulfide isomerase
MRVDIWSDVACPWCYVGKRHLEDALARFDHRDEVAVVWRSFQLDPDAPPVPESDSVTRLARKYRMSEDEARAMIDRMTRVGAADGLDLRFDRARPGNTFDAHRLIHLGARHGRQDEVKERLLAATFTDGEVISDHETLARLGEEAGLDIDEARAVLAGDDYAGDVRADLDQARAYGISAVPFFVIDGRFGIAGAQPADVLVGVLQEVWAESRVRELASVPAPGCESDACEV